MDIADIASSAVQRVVKLSGKKLQNKPVPDLSSVTPVKMKNTKNNMFSVGFASAEVMPANVLSEKYYLAGFKMNNIVTDVLDPTTVSAMWLSCSEDSGILLVSADIIGITGFEVKLIRDSLSEFCRKTGCVNIIVSCTHCHASLDTVGYWGKLPKTGKNEAYMKKLFSTIEDLCVKAYDKRTHGELFYGEIRVPQAIKDTREPMFCNDKLTRLRFVPADGGDETWYMNFGAHPNTLGGANTKISADYPYWMREYIYKEKKVNILFSVGAILAVNIADVAENNYERAKVGGELLGAAALEITEEIKLDAEMIFVKKPYYIPIDNAVLGLMSVIHAVNSLKYACKISDTGLALLSEMDYIKIGGKIQILTLPGEAMPEFIYGGYATAETSATGKGAEINSTPLCEICSDDNLIIFGVTNDMTGYMVPENDFILHKTQPYLTKTKDRFDRNHYHETNSLGPNTCKTVSEEFSRIIEAVKNI